MSEHPKSGSHNEMTDPPLKSKSKEGSGVGHLKSKESAGIATKSKTSIKSKSGEHSKEHSKESRKSAGKPKSGEKPKSKDGSKPSHEHVVLACGNPTATKSKTSIKSGDKRHHHHHHQGKPLSGAKIGFVGAGKMTEAIVRGLIHVAKLNPKQMYVAGKTGKTLESFRAHGLTVSTRSYDIFGQFDCDIVFLCVHGFVIRSCFKGGGTRPFACTVNYIPNQKHQLFLLSLIGGVSLGDIKLTLFDPDHPEKYIYSMNRVMLNIGIAYGKNIGIGALDTELDSKKVNPVVRDILSSIATIEFFPEQLMDAACAVGGNGLAFVFYFVSHLSEGGFKMGLNKTMAKKLASMAVQSAAECLVRSGKHPSELQDMVTSRAGPASYGLQFLDKANVSSGVESAIQATYNRLKELVHVEPIIEEEAKLLFT